jgi:hypothetical protein
MLLFNFKLKKNKRGNKEVIQSAVLIHFNFKMDFYKKAIILQRREK